MKLTVNQCLDRIKSPANTAQLWAARRQEDRLLFHCEPVTDQNRCSRYLTDWLSWVETFLPPDKFTRFKQLVQFPVETVDTTDSIFDELSKLFDTPDKAINFEFTVQDYEQDFIKYIEKNLDDENFWKVKGLEALRTKINSFLVVDLPPVQQTERPEPYYYILDCSAVHDVMLNPQSGAVEYIAFKQADDSIVFIEDTAYRVFWRPQSGSEWQLKTEAVHSVYRVTTDAQGQTEYGELVEGLGYAPVCSFYEPFISGSGRLNKKGPLTKSLSKLDWMLFWRIAKKYFDLYGPFPIVVRYTEDCAYKDEHGNMCEGGYINYIMKNGVGGEPCAAQKPCPACSKRGLVGPGSDWTVDAPRTKEQADLMQNPVKVVEMSTENLDYVEKELQRQEREIMVKSVGRMLSEATKEAINEQQVRSQYEAQQAIMNRLREEVEKSRAFAYSTAARLRYGRYFISGSVFMGRQYFLYSPTDLQLQLKGAKDSGLPTYEVARIRETYSRTSLKSNELEYQRAYILSQLEPYVDRNLTELMTLGVKEIDPEGYILKLNFTNFIARFERENLNVVEFGSLLAFDVKINAIAEILRGYAAAYKIPEPPPVAGAGAAGGK